MSIFREFANYSIFFGDNWAYKTVESQRVTKFKYPRKITLKVCYTYWLKLENVHSALEQNSECPHSLHKRKLLSST